ncbi:MAG: SGNH/GDSL hydrolase family protein [Clostridia bacterium]|nr:SGNH/GDSL hydrolase family protein [Clostridia bacterium]
MNSTDVSRNLKKLNVAYFGGSVTDGHGSTVRENSWRRLTTKWLENTYGVNVNEVNGAIGGTGTKYGVYRVIEHLKLTSVIPDLVFIEFSVNDYYDGLTENEAAFNMEYIINTVYEYAPKADIVMVFTGEYATMSAADPDSFVTRKAHKAVADAYGIPTVDVATPLWNLMCEENGGVKPTQSTDVWKRYVTDQVHPSDAGYAEYAKTVQAFLKQTFDAKRYVFGNVADAYRRTDTLHDLTALVKPHVATFAGCTFADPDVQVTATVGSPTNPTGCLLTNKAGASFSFDFTGTDLKLWIYGHSGDADDSDRLSVEIDGVTVKGDFGLVMRNANHKILDVTSELMLENTKHTVTVKLNANSAGIANLDLRYVMISGDAERRGISNVK